MKLRVSVKSGEIELDNETVFKAMLLSDEKAKEEVTRAIGVYCCRNVRIEPVIEPQTPVKPDADAVIH